MFRTRFAPSPTGYMHIGNLRLYAYLLAKKHKGVFILRIEDTDQSRNVPAALAAIYNGLALAGITYDEGPDKDGGKGPYVQSQRLPIYKKYAEELIAKGAAYYCFCQKEDKPEAEDQPAHPDVTRDPCLFLTEAEARARLSCGVIPVVRQRIPEGGSTSFDDHVYGRITIDNSQLDDQVLLKSDGFPTYNFANVVDDHLMEITHVIRAEEWINSTPKHLMLYEAFGWDPPQFVHLPLLRNADRSKISKRKNPVSLLYFKQIGILPEAMLNFLAMMGHSMTDEREVFTLDEFVKEFSFDRISLGGPVFDLEKMLWLNGVHIRNLDDDELARRLIALMFTPEAMKPLIPLIRERIRTLGEYPDAVAYFPAPEVEIPLLDIYKAGKGMTTAQIAKLLRETVEFLDGMREFSSQWLEEGLRTFCEQKEVPVKILFMMLRLCGTGRKATPPLFDTFVVLGKAAVGQRMRAAADAIAAWKPPAI